MHLSKCTIVLRLETLPMKDRIVMAMDIALCLARCVLCTKCTSHTSVEMHKLVSTNPRDFTRWTSRSSLAAFLDRITSSISTDVTSRNISRTCQTSAFLVRLYPLELASQFSLSPALSQHCLRD